MVSYSIYGEDQLKVLRMAFTPNLTEGIAGVFIPAVYCAEYFQDEIEAEKSGQSSSTFYTDTYGYKMGDQGLPHSQWICPNLTQSTLSAKGVHNLLATVQECANGVGSDPSFAPDIDCIAESSYEEYMTKTQLGYQIERQRMNTNFVPSMYHNSEELQHFV